MLQSTRSLRAGRDLVTEHHHHYNLSFYLILYLKIHDYIMYGTVDL